jgi:hypothetical protein
MAHLPAQGRIALCHISMRDISALRRLEAWRGCTTCAVFSVHIVPDMMACQGQAGLRKYSSMAFLLVRQGHMEKVMRVSF